MGAAEPSVTTVFVDATMTLVVTVDARQLGLVSMQVDNLSAETFSGFLRRRVSSLMSEATSSMPDFSEIQPLGSVDGSGNPTDSVMADVDVEGSATLELYGRMTGAGGNVRVSYRKAGPKP